MHPTPTILLTGFFGSGKTSLINAWLHAQPTHKIGVVINEFGQMGIDSTLLGSNDIVELGGGCVCCATGAELWESAAVLIERTQAQRLVVETSGIADPSVLLAQYRDLPLELQQQFDLRGIVCVVDPTGIHTAATNRPEAIHQLQSAQRFVITKQDKATGEQLAATHAFLEQTGCSRERAMVSASATRSLHLELFEWVFSKNPSLSNQPTHEHFHTGQLQAVGFVSKTPLLKHQLQQVIESTQGQLLRVKGIVRLWQGTTKPATWYNVQWAGQHLTWEVFEPTGDPPLESALLFIGEGLDEMALRVRLSTCCLSSDT